MKQYLTYLHWYCTIALALDVTVDMLLERPVFTETWFIPEGNDDPVWTDVPCV